MKLAFGLGRGEGFIYLCLFVLLLLRKWKQPLWIQGDVEKELGKQS